MTIYVGIDGGGTKTEVAILDTSVKQMISVTGDASNPNSVGWDEAVGRIRGLIAEGLSRLDVQSTDVAAVCAGVAGVDRPDDVKRLTEALHETYPEAVIGVANDALAALTAGTRGKSGVVLIAGTGSIAVGEGNDGQVARSGGYGYLIGDEGSGFAIGREGIMAALQAAEGRGPETTLWQECQVHYDIRRPQELIPTVYQSNHPVGAIASFARLVLGQYGKDAAATAIVERAVDHHAGLITSVLSQLADKVDRIVVLAGGMYTNVPILKDRLQNRLPDVQLLPLTLTPAAGAVLRGMLLTATSSPTGFEHRDELVRLWNQVVQG